MTGFEEEAGAQESDVEDPAEIFRELDYLINVKEDAAEAERKAMKAVGAFRELRDVNLGIDAMRYLVLSWKLLVEQWRYENAFGSKYDIKDVLMQGDQFCMRALEEFKEAGETRGEGAMLLSLAQLNYDKRGPKKRALALEWASSAERCLRQVRDDKLLFLALLAQSNIHFSGGLAKKALEKAQQAVNIAIRCGELESQASALYMVGMSCGLDRNLKLGLEAHIEALSLYRETGNRKMQAFQLWHIAEWQLKRQRPREALQPSQEALRIFEEIQSGKGWHGTALRTVVQCHLVREDYETALKQTLVTMNVFKDSNSKKMITLCYDILAHVYLAMDELLLARECAESAVVACKGLQDDELEAIYRQTLARVYERLGEEHVAIHQVQASSDLYGKIGDHVHECRVLLDLSRVYLNSGNPTAALAEAQKASQLAMEKNEVSEQGNALLVESKVHLYNEDYQRALDITKDAADLFSKDGNATGQGLAWSALAEIRKKMGDVKGAMASAKRGRLMLATSEKLRLQASGYQSLADLHMSCREYRQALKLGHEAKAVCHKAEDKYGEIWALITVMSASVQLLAGEAPLPQSSGEYEEILAGAQAANKAAIEIAERIIEPNIKGVVKFWSANLTVIAKGHASALEEAQEAHSLLVEGRDRWNEGRVMFLLGSIHQNDKDIHKATDFYKEALEIARMMNDADGEEAARKVLTKMGVLPEASPSGTQSSGKMQRRTHQQQLSEPIQGITPPMLPNFVSDISKEGSTEVSTSESKAHSLPKAEADKPQVIVPTKDQVRSSLLKLASDVTSREEDITADIAVVDFGIDSLAAVQFRNDVSKEYDLALPATLLFDYPTIEEVASHIVAALAQELAG